MININACLKIGGKPLGVLSIGGSPGRYTLRRGLTGQTLAAGKRDIIIKALNLCLADNPDNYQPPTYADQREPPPAA